MINELKAKVYDTLVMIERHQLAIRELQKQVQELNEQIAKEEQKKSELPDKDAA